MAIARLQGNLRLQSNLKLYAGSVSAAAPTAEFVGVPVSGVEPLSVSFTDQSTGLVSEYSWDFGDGDTSAAASPTHIFASAGVFTISLTVSGPGGADTETKVGYIEAVEPAPVSDFTGVPVSGVDPLTVAFSEQAVNDVTGYSWTFGDGGTSTSANPDHTYTSAGFYTVSLTVSGPGGSDTETKINYIQVGEPAPVADFSGTPVSGDYPLSVSFTDSTVGTVTEYSWDFGDGDNSAATNPTHSYTSAGFYTVSLTVSGPGGSDTETKVDYIQANEPPVPASAEFMASPVSGNIPLVVTFTDQSTGDFSEYAWSFGDGDTSAAANPTHTYASAGSYTVSLTVSGAGGTSTEEKVNYIFTSAEPAPAYFNVTENRSLRTSAESTLTGGDYFGASVGMSYTGDVAVVGAYQNDSNDIGGFFIYELVSAPGEWAQVSGVFVPASASNGDNVGFRVDICSNGDTLVASAHQEDDPASNAGGAYVYFKASAGATWTQQASLIGSDSAADDAFGRAVHLSKTGDYLAIGAPFTDYGSYANVGTVYIFKRTTGTWAEEAIIQVSAPDHTGYNFGYSLSLSEDGDRLAVGAQGDDIGAGTGAGSVFVYTRSGTTWSLEQNIPNPNPNTGDAFGRDVSISGDGSVLVIGAYRDDTDGTDRGSVYVYNRTGSTWAQTQRLTPSDAANGDNFGEVVRIATDGNAIAVGVPIKDSSRGAVYTYGLSAASWVQKQKLQPASSVSNDQVGGGLDISSDGKVIIIGAPGTDWFASVNTGQAYIYDNP